MVLTSQRVCRARPVGSSAVGMGAGQEEVGPGGHRRAAPSAWDPGGSAVAVFVSKAHVSPQNLTVCGWDTRVIASTAGTSESSVPADPQWPRPPGENGGVCVCACVRVCVCEIGRAHV